MWKRCKICHNMKQEVEFYKSGEYRIGTCKSCLKEKRKKNKQEKREYDKNRYAKNISIKEGRQACTRCGKYYANVQNNQMFFCFHCLQYYEEKHNVKISVIVVDKTIRKIN